MKREDEKHYVFGSGWPRFVVMGNWGDAAPGKYFVFDCKTGKRRGNFAKFVPAIRRAELLQRRARIK